MRTWICDVCHKSFWGEQPDNTLKLIVEKPDCDLILLKFDICVPCDENKVLGGMYWRNKITEILKEHLHAVSGA